MSTLHQSELLVVAGVVVERKPSVRVNRAARTSTRHGWHRRRTFAQASRRAVLWQFAALWERRPHLVCVDLSCDIRIRVFARRVNLCLSRCQRHVQPDIGSGDGCNARQDHPVLDAVGASHWLLLPPLARNCTQIFSVATAAGERRSAARTVGCIDWNSQWLR